MSDQPVNGDSATAAPQAADGDQATRRYKRLIRELADEHGAPKHGWGVRVATRLGIDPSFLSRLVSGEKKIVGADSIDKAVHHLGIHRGYFEDPTDPVSYREYLGAELPLREPTFPGWLEFIMSPIGYDVTASERRTLASIVFEDGYEPLASFYEGMLYMLRNRLTPAEAARGIAKAKDLAEQMQQNRNRP